MKWSCPAGWGRSVAWLVWLLWAPAAQGQAPARPTATSSSPAAVNATASAPGGVTFNGPRRADPRSLGLIQRSDLNRGVIIGRAGPVEFDLPPNAAMARVILNPGLSNFEDVRRQRLSNSDLRLRYTVQVEALDGRGRMFLRREYSFRRDLLEATLPDGTTTTGAFYLDASAPVPLRSDEVLLDFQGLSLPARLRLRLVSADATITEVLGRAYAPAPLTRRDATVQWQRLSQEQRARLASGNLFPPQVLTQAERERLIVTGWTPVAPRRGAGVRELYVVRDLPSTEPVDTVLPPLPGLPSRAGKSPHCRFPSRRGRSACS